ncbi:MAG: putative toxin-antitoxin system toxin component, PIN family [Thermodesulfovibrionia bacterium]|nr:putative toxin-antitoxin system toxin component, PIN family [Thermodesulfovibrionia bacterium]
MPKSVLVLIDTNVWVSAFVNRKGYPARVKEKFLKREFEIVISTPLLKELSDVLKRPRIKDQYKITDEEIELFVEILAGIGHKVYLSEDINLCRDHKDNMVLETAIKGGVDYLVTRDDDIKRDIQLIEELRKNGIKVLPVSKFLKMLGE